MVVRRISRWSLIIKILFGVFPAIAQTNSPAPGAGSGGKFRAACGADLQRFCIGVQPGGGRLVQFYHPILVSFAACGIDCGRGPRRRQTPRGLWCGPPAILRHRPTWWGPPR